MSTLTGTFISQSYGSVIHLSTNTGIVAGVNTQLEDGFGAALGVYVNTNGTVTATTFAGNVTGNVTGNLTGTASFANRATTSSYAATAQQATSASFASVATSASYAAFATSASAAVTSSFAHQARSSSYAITSSYAANADLLDGLNSTQFATTASNTFVGNQVITGSVTTIGTVRTVGNTTITGSLNVSGSSHKIVGNTTVTGSINQNIITVPYPVDINDVPTTYTASMDFRSGSFFILTLPNAFSQPMHITSSNIQPGSSAALQVIQGLSGSCQVTFDSTFKFPSGSAYQAFNSASAVDVVTFISFDGVTLKSAGANNFI